MRLTQQHRFHSSRIFDVNTKHHKTQKVLQRSDHSLYVYRIFVTVILIRGREGKMDFKIGQKQSQTIS